MRSAVGIKKSYIELFTDSRLFWGGKTRIRNWFFKKNSSTQMSLSGGPTTTLALWIFTKKKGFYTQHSITGHFTPIAPIQPGQLDIPKSTYLQTVLFTQTVPAEITPPSNTLNLYWETHAGTREQSRNLFGSVTTQPELQLTQHIHSVVFSVLKF